MSTRDSLITRIENQFFPAFEMLGELLRNSPNHLWYKNPYGQPVWKRCLHTLESIDWHFNDFDRYIFPDIPKNVSAEFNTPPGDTLTREELIDYCNLVLNKCRKAFSVLDDERILQRPESNHKESYLEIILQQIRHLSFNLGCCDEALQANGFNRLEWIDHEK